LRDNAALRTVCSNVNWRKDFLLPFEMLAAFDSAYARAILRADSGGRGDAAVTGILGTNMEDLLREYLPILVFLGLSLVIGLALLIAPFLIAPSKPDPEKLSAYECGFDAFDDARMKFDVKYYLVAILFIIFDLEVAFLFPWAIALGDVGMFGFWSMIVFLGVLTIGFTYEWKRGALEWE
jgi:NADH-quinone oxidoreductase subunit A